MPAVLARTRPGDWVYVDGWGHKAIGQKTAPVVPAASSSTAPSQTAETPGESLARAASPLLRVVDLHRRHLTAEDREHLTARLAAMGYVGAVDSQLIEYCLEHDLSEVLDESFTGGALHRILAELADGKRLDALAPRGEVVARILEHLGVRVPAQPVGIGALRHRAQKAAHRLKTCRDRPSMRGLVGEAGGVLERVLLALVRFYGAVLFGP